MGKLHELLAVEADKEGIAKRILEETCSLFKNKHQIFTGGSKVLKMDEEGQESVEAAGSEYQEIVTTVPERMQYNSEHIIDWLDAVAQKESTNQKAVADIIIDGCTIATGLPATFLLGLEAKLKLIRKAYDLMPTLAPGVAWEKDETKEHTWRSRDPDIKTKTRKEPKFRVLYEATKEHPAQIEKWNEEVAVGKYTSNYTSGMISPSEKMKVLRRIDKLTQAVKQARMRANSVEVEHVKIGGELLDYINRG